MLRETANILRKEAKDISNMIDFHLILIEDIEKWKIYAGSGTRRSLALAPTLRGSHNGRISGFATLRPNALVMFI